MKPSSQELIRGIAWVLEREVLPELQTTSWTASYVRSCLMVLAHLEERVVHEGEILCTDNEELRGLLRQARTQLAPVAGCEALTQAVAAVLDEARPGGGYSSVERLEEENTAYKEVLDRLITELHRRRGALAAETYEAVHAIVLAYLRRASEREAVLFRKTGGLSPL
jgi:hypothetical protein